MEPNPYKPPNSPLSVEQSDASLNDALENPILAYTANGNLEAQSVVTWLESHDVRAHAVEDISGFSQFHTSQVFVDKSDLERAVNLLRQFESQRDKRRAKLDNAPPITSKCEECGVSSEFPTAQDGTTQSCPKCHAFMDVGTFDWLDDFDFRDLETAPQTSYGPDTALDSASKLDKSGDWNAAIIAYREIADRWPEHATYVSNCIADVQRKLDAAR